MIKQKRHQVDFKAPFNQAQEQCFLGRENVIFFKSFYCLKKTYLRGEKDFKLEDEIIKPTKLKMVFSVSKKRKASVLKKNQGLILLHPIRNWGEFRLF